MCRACDRMYAERAKAAGERVSRALREASERRGRARKQGYDLHLDGVDARGLPKYRLRHLAQQQLC